MSRNSLRWTKKFTHYLYHNPEDWESAFWAVGTGAHLRTTPSTEDAGGARVCDPQHVPLLGNVVINLPPHPAKGLLRLANLLRERAGMHPVHRLDFHRNNRRALPITIKSEKPMAAAHQTGLAKPVAASGTPRQL